MIVCDSVKDSVWYDPRVRKQIDGYIDRGMEVIAVGVMDPRYDSTEIAKIPCKVLLSNIIKTQIFFKKFGVKLKQILIYIA